MLTGRGGIYPFLTLLLVGLVVRAAALPLPGTVDVTTFKIWTYNAATLGPAQVYGVGGSPPTRRTLIYNGETAQVDYPPLALDELAVVGRGYRALFPTFPDGTGLTIAVKLPAVAADFGLAMLIFATVSRIAGAAAGQRAALAYWLNPAVILDGSMLGYIDALCVRRGVPNGIGAPAAKPGGGACVLGVGSCFSRRDAMRGRARPPAGSGCIGND